MGYLRKGGCSIPSCLQRSCDYIRNRVDTDPVVPVPAPVGSDSAGPEPDRVDPYPADPLFSVKEDPYPDLMNPYNVCYLRPHFLHEDPELAV